MSGKEAFSSLEEEASNDLVQRLHGPWTSQDQAALEARLATDLQYAEAYRLAEQSAGILRKAAEMPEMMRLREQALAHARRSSVGRWTGAKSGRGLWRLAAGLTGVMTLGLLWQLSPWGFRPGEYRTGIGEQRIVELADHSRVTLDARTRLLIHYTDTARTIELREGQAQFSVAHDPSRPFTVQAGDRAIMALGTVFTVEYTAERVNVVLLDGKVAVMTPDSPRSASEPANHPQTASSPASPLRAIELSPGEELKVSQDGHTTLIPKADMEAATAWREGKVIFRTERLVDAIQRVNRYSHVQLEVIDPALADETVSGVFEAGDTQGFIAGVQLVLPVIAQPLDSSRIRLRYR